MELPLKTMSISLALGVFANETSYRCKDVSIQVKLIMATCCHQSLSPQPTTAITEIPNQKLNHYTKILKLVMMQLKPMKNTLSDLADSRNVVPNLPKPSTSELLVLLQHC